MDRKIFKIISFILISRALLYILPWIFKIIITPQAPPQTFLEFLNSWNHWDAPHYLYLSQNGYTNVGDEANFIVFFPLYPMLIGLFNIIFRNPLITGMILSNLFFIIGSVIFYKLLLLDYSGKFASRAVYLLAIFPTAYFFSAPYTESLFFALCVGSFYFARKENFLAAGSLAGLAAFTRPFGFLVIIALLFEFTKINKKTIIATALILIPGIFFISVYLLINQIVYGSPFAFQSILHNNWYKEFANPIGGISKTWHLAIEGKLNHHTLMVGWAEAITSSISIILIPFAFKFLRRSWAVYYSLSILLFTSTSFILSSPRYLLSLPPFFILLSLAAKKINLRAWQFFSIALLYSLTLIYTSGQWAF